MMKMSKTSHKLSRSSRESPIRKDHMIKKTMHPSASMRVSATSSRPMMKRLSPGMKRGPPMPPSKSVHPSRVRSIASPPHRSVTRHSMQGSPVAMDRVHGLKRLKYEKRKISPSPNRRPMPPSSFAMREASPYHEERYLNIKPQPITPHYSPPPPKKKSRREADKFDHGEQGLVMMHRPEMRQHPEARILHRSEITSSRSAPMPAASHRSHMASSVHDRNDHFDHHGRGRGGPTPIASSSHSKRPPPPPTIKPSYEPQRNERYSAPSSSSRYPTRSPDKHYTPTLHERFSSVVESTRTEPRIKYSREDLEKITIDIHRNIKAESPTVRRIVNPDDVKLVRRANEGHRPMFDREEIKQASRDMRDEAHYEKKGMGGGIYSASHSVGSRDVENYEITRHKFDPHRQAFHSSSGRSLSDRWQNANGRKDEGPLDRDDRESEYERHPMKRSFSDARTSKAGDRDFRSERYSGPSSSQGRSEYPPSQHHMISPPSESRHSSSIHRKPSAPMDARRKLNVVRKTSDRGPSPSMRPDSKSRYPTVEKRYPDGLSSRIDKPIARRSPGMDPPVWKTKSRSDSREKVSSFSRRPDKYSYKSLPEKSDGPGRSSNYYEDNRESSDSYRGRGSSRPYRSSRGSRSRGFRGSSRGSFPTRSFRGGYRGRGAPRRGRISPGIWEHDMYLRGSDDHKLDFP